MQKLRYFLLGAATVSFIIPLLEGLTNLLIAGMQAVMGKWALKLTEYQAQMRKLDLEYPDEPPHHQIGFAVDTSEEEYDDDDDF